MKKALVTLFLILSVLPSIFAGGRQEQPLYIPEKGTIVYLEGEVSVDREPAEIGQIVGLGTAIETGSGSMCEVVFGEKNVFRLFEDTFATFTLNEATIEIERGALGAVFTRLTGLSTDDGSNFRVQSPQVVAGVRGTVFYLKTLDDSSTYLCTCHGTVEQGGFGAKSRRRVSRYHHGAYIYTLTDEGVRTKKAGLEYHSDGIMEEIAEAINADIDWGNPRDGSGD
jgi:hypothetical protein